jgi:hypothetical protein
MLRQRRLDRVPYLTIAAEMNAHFGTKRDTASLEKRHNYHIKKHHPEDQVARTRWTEEHRALLTQKASNGERKNEAFWERIATEFTTAFGSERTASSFRAQWNMINPQKDPNHLKRLRNWSQEQLDWLMERVSTEKKNNWVEICADMKERFGEEWSKKKLESKFRHELKKRQENGDDEGSQGDDAGRG